MTLPDDVKRRLVLVRGVGVWAYWPVLRLGLSVDLAYAYASLKSRMAACPGGWSSTRVSHEKGAKDLSSPQPFTMMCRLDEQAVLQPVLFISVYFLEQFASRLVSVDYCRTHRSALLRAPAAFISDSTAHPM